MNLLLCFIRSLIVVSVQIIYLLFLLTVYSCCQSIIVFKMININALFLSYYHFRAEKDIRIVIF